MITHIDGKLVEKTPTYAVIDCSGVGYFLNISLNTFSKIGTSERCKLFTHITVNTMDGTQTMYGFFEESERVMFRLLLSVSGVGAGAARLLLSSFGPSELQQVIVSANVTGLRSVKGIGEKTAQRIIVDLKDKVLKEEIPASISFSPHNNIRNEALAALVMLGFVRHAAEKAIDKAMTSATQEMNVENTIKQALKFL
ncbi:MAG: Holliday junction branch migration protein RuvA [Bacteroidetes bacterium]|nr:Holliday junction branch migration protein RuvA [Bacteroidota bacterium]MBK9672372.1 Holliday junction branch migration protein RuvA [Bacteroidota bacterium]MBK9799993.1 Holliday junction branch migration protein RuvA [Bacteroidota bacterium]MBP6414415.1 Holliday junction branch migration protein RuvA [Bacteroidia bacterium]